MLGHSAGANVALQYAVRHPSRVSGLLLITPSGRAVGLEPDTAMRREIVSLRWGEPWFEHAAAAFERLVAGGEAEQDWAATAPFFYGRWDAAAQAHDAAGEKQTNDGAAAAFAAEGAFDPPPRGSGRPGRARARHRRPPRSATAASGDRRVRRAVRARATGGPAGRRPLPLAR